MTQSAEEGFGAHTMNRAELFCTDARTDSPMRLSFPSCEELGIPMHSEDFPGRLARPSGFHLQHMKTPPKTDPFSPFSMIPLPSPFVLDPTVEPTFIRKRNERERERVRCVNDGYSRLKEHIPLDNKDKRVSKVEILRTAISYIKHLQTLLEDDNVDVQDENDNTKSEHQQKGLKRAMPFSDESDGEESEMSTSRETSGKCFRR
ncbi:achaete-scute homolog 3-like [Liolophura sinensis]|uniref:achaete-scute homolog 3-like n=1 Tax=Liolophura sinensis TaxID=3198878 RepID=UPI003158C775